MENGRYCEDDWGEVSEIRGAGELSFFEFCLCCLSEYESKRESQDGQVEN